MNFGKKRRPTDAFSFFFCLGLSLGKSRFLPVAEKKIRRHPARRAVAKRRKIHILEKKQKILLTNEKFVV